MQDEIEDLLRRVGIIEAGDGSSMGTFDAHRQEIVSYVDQRSERMIAHHKLLEKLEGEATKTGHRFERLESVTTQLTALENGDISVILPAIKAKVKRILEANTDKIAETVDRKSEKMKSMDDRLAALEAKPTEEPAAPIDLTPITDKIDHLESG